MSKNKKLKTYWAGFAKGKVVSVYFWSNKKEVMRWHDDVRKVNVIEVKP